MVQSLYWRQKGSAVTEFLTIGRLAERAGVGVETVRFYERKGLLQEPDRKPSGYRQYKTETVARLRFIRRAKELGFTLKEIQELFALRVDPSTNCVDVQAKAVAKLDNIEGRIRMLQKMKRSLVKLTKACSGNGTTAACPILESLEKEGAD